MYINDTSKEQKTHEEVVALYPSSAIPADGVTAIFDWHYVLGTTAPVIDSSVEKLVPGTPVWNGSAYEEVWETVPLTPQEIVEVETLETRAAAQAIQAHLDAQAVSMGYDSIHTAVTYADEDSVPTFQNDGLALRAWRSAVWAVAYTLLDEVKAGTRPKLSPEEVIALLPVYGS